MTTKSIIVTALLFVIWTIVLKLSGIQSVPQSQMQNNLVIAERYMHDEVSAENVILGSSVSARLNMNFLPEFVNLSLSGLSIYDGFEILAAKKELPKNLYIETNFISRPENEEFRSLISSPVLSTLKDRLVALRSDRQPIGALNYFVITPLLYRLNDIIKGNRSNPSNTILSYKASEPNTQLFEKLLNREIKVQSIAKSPYFMDTRISILEKYVEYFQGHGINVFFFEVPKNENVSKLAIPSTNRDEIRRNFPKTPFIELPPNAEDYKTTDGIHLGPTEATRYTKYLYQEITERNSKNRLN